MKIVILADSLALARPPSEGDIPYEATYPYLLDLSLRRQWGANAPLIIERGMRRRTIEYVLDDWLEMVELRTADVVVIHVGIVDCAPRVFLRREANMVARVRPARLRNFIFDYVHRNRRRIVEFRRRVYVPVDRFTRLLNEVIERARAAGVRSLIFVNIITPPDELEERSPGFQRNVQIYNGILAEAAARESWVHVIDLNSLIENEGGARELLVDGIHINREGHKILARELEGHIAPIMEDALVEHAPARTRDLAKG